MATKKAKAIDLTGLSDDDLIGLLVGVRKEAERRGIAAEAAGWVAALADPDRERIAREAAEAEAARLRKEEARRVAREAAERVRCEAEEARRREEAEKAQARAARLRAIAVRARELFGSDRAEFTVKIWERKGDKRLYIGGGYAANWVEYYHTGNSRTAPRSIAFRAPALKDELAAHLGVTPDEAKDRIKQFCAEICDGWQTLDLDVNASNAPLDPSKAEG